MKIRTDFVTNSSSSSFIIARLFNCKLQGDMIEKLFDIYIRSTGDVEYFSGDGEFSEHRIETKEDLERHFYDYDGSKIDKVLEVLNSGTQLQYISISHHYRDKIVMLHDLEDTGYIKVLHSWSE